MVSWLCNSLTLLCSSVTAAVLTSMDDAKPSSYLRVVRREAMLSASTCSCIFSTSFVLFATSEAASTMMRRSSDCSYARFSCA